MGNPFVHVDLTADDRGAAKKFYKGVFDWKLTDMPAMQWTGIGVGDGVGGGMSDKHMPGQPTAWVAYVGVASVKKTLAKAAKLGATIVQDYMPVGDMGALGVFINPQGAALGVWEQGKKAPAKKATKKAAKKAAPKKAAKKAAPKKKAAKKWSG